MARFTFKLPDIGEGIAEAEIVAWHVAIGDRVEEDQGLADMMTDKATVEMESPVAGIVIELAGEVGDQVAIGSPLVVIETDSDASEAPAEDPPVSGEVEQQVEAENPGVEEAIEAPAPIPVEASAKQQAPASEGKASTSTPSLEASATAPAKVLASPAVRARAADLGIDLSQVKSDGDRLRHADLDAFLRYGSGQGYHAPIGSRARADEAIKVIGMRRKIAENMAASKRTIPHFTYVDEIDVTELERVRADLNDNRGGRPKLTMLPLLIAAICRTVPEFPMLNARYDDEAGVVTRHGAVHMGMATQTDQGLSVAVIRNAEGRDVWGLAAEISRLAEATRTGKATREELSGGTITISSLGPMGGVVSTPVINRPEVAIIAVNKVKETPIVEGGQIKIAKMMNLSISCDHRVVDGWDAASFMQELKKILEAPLRLLA